MEQKPLYSCRERQVNHFPPPDDEVWINLPKMKLCDTENGDAPRLSTEVKAFWNKSRTTICFKFDCEDKNIVSTMFSRDDPIYKEDVVEVFISHTGSLNNYKEFEVSPANVKFDAIIRNYSNAPIQVIKSWNAQGWRTECCVKKDQSQFSSIWEIPLESISPDLPSKGDVWRMNCYRIDRDPNNPFNDEYTAWSPTGALNFHIPEKFGFLRFD